MVSDRPCEHTSSRVHLHRASSPVAGSENKRAIYIAAPCADLSLARPDLFLESILVSASVAGSSPLDPAAVVMATQLSPFHAVQLWLFWHHGEGEFPHQELVNHPDGCDAVDVHSPRHEPNGCLHSPGPPAETSRYPR